jgi:hypothetical protein
MSGSDLAVLLDEEMLRAKSVIVSDAGVPDASLPKCVDLADQVGGRHLIKYLREGDHRRYAGAPAGSYFGGIHYVTPTPLRRRELVRVLNLPTGLPAPRYALLLDPLHLDAWGPRRIRSGRGIEYLLLNGFSADAISGSWPIEVA